MKIDSLGNIYIQSPLNNLELSYLQAFSSSVHYDNNEHEFLGLYDISVLEHHMLNKQFIFDLTLDSQRSLHSNFDKEAVESVFFPFFKSPLNFTEKAIKFNFPDIKNVEEFLFFIQHISQSLLFYFKHFFSINAYCQQLDKDFFDFFSMHSISGNVYFKLSAYGHIYRLTCGNDHIALFKGYYPTAIRGKNYHIHNDKIYDISIKKQLESVYNKLSTIDIKNNALFEEEGTIFSFQHSDTLDKLLQFHQLNSKLQAKSKNKISKI